MYIIVVDNCRQAQLFVDFLILPMPDTRKCWTKLFIQQIVDTVLLRNDYKSGYLREGKGILYDESGNATIYKGKFKNGKRNDKGVLYKNKLKDTLICGHNILFWFWISLFLLIVVITLVIGILIFLQRSNHPDCLLRSDSTISSIIVSSNTC